MKPADRIRRRLGRLALAAALTATALVEALHASGLARGAEQVYADLWHRQAGVRFEPRSTALVLVDERSLLARPDEPLAFWSPHFARALQTLREAGVRLVAVDLIFSFSPERWLAQQGLGSSAAARDFDRALREQIHAGGVLLAAYALGPGERPEDFLLPSPDYLLALPGMDLVGHLSLANLRTDPDGVVRQLSTSASSGAVAEGLPRYTIAGLAAARALGLDLGKDLQERGLDFGAGRLQPDGRLRVNFAGPPGSYRALSFETLLQPGASALPEVRALAGKVVVLGAGYAGDNDVHATPYSTGLSGGQGLMSGPELQANMIETLLHGQRFRELPAAGRLAAFAAAFGLLALLAVRLPAWRTLLLLGAGLPAVALIGYCLFLQYWLLPVAHLQLGMLAALGLLLPMRLTRAERERRRVGRMFARYVSPEVVKQLLVSERLPELGGQVREVTLLFMDIRNFTTVSERLPAPEVIELLNRFFERACAELLRQGATIDKFIGDAVMAEFGAPLDQPDHAARALRAAVALQRVAAEFGDWMRQRFAGIELPAFAVGVGLHSGEAVVGNMGSSTRMEYTAVGDTVNLASRLEGQTKETGCAILASAATVAAAGGSAVTGRRLVLQVKGHARPVEAFEILDAR